MSKNQIVEKDYVMMEKFRGDWLPVKGLRARPEAIEELNRDTFRTGVKYEEGTMEPKKQKEVSKEKSLDQKSIAELKHFAEENGIDLGDARRKISLYPTNPFAKSTKMPEKKQIL